MFMNVHWPTVGASVGILLIIVVVVWIANRPKAQRVNYNYPGTV